jgi:[FeFe] hydrogenase H-cluster maturation GTPase HydF
LILPQQQVIRDCLDNDAIAIVTKEYELTETLDSLGKKPALVITDSQAFLKVMADTPNDIPVTSFSILFARYKGELFKLVEGLSMLNNLKKESKLLVVEGCTHHRQSDDIGTVKIPRWIRQHTGMDVDFQWAAGTNFPENLEEFNGVIHCGACMLNGERNET